MSDGAFDWAALEADVEGLNDPVHDDDARHVLLGVMTAAAQIGLRRQLWSAVSEAIPAWDETFAHAADEDLPDTESLEWARMCDLVIDAVPIAEDWLREWLTVHGVPYLTAPVMCPSHGIFMYVIAGDPLQVTEDLGDDVVEGLNTVVEVVDDGE